MDMYCEQKLNFNLTKSVGLSSRVNSGLTDSAKFRVDSTCMASHLSAKVYLPRILKSAKGKSENLIWGKHSILGRDLNMIERNP